MESVPGEGSLFEVYFPLPERIKSGEYVKFPTGPYRYGNGSSMVVDDEPLILKVVTMALTKAGYTVTSFTSTEKAFAAGFISMAGNLALLLNGIGLAVTFTILLVTANTMSMAVRELSAAACFCSV